MPYPTCNASSGAIGPSNIGDTLTSFRMQDAPICAAYVTTTQLMPALIAPFSYPPVVQRHLSDLATCGLLMAGMLQLRHKSQGTISLQIKQGFEDRHAALLPLRFMVVEIRPHGDTQWHIRACAHLESSRESSGVNTPLLEAEHGSITDLFPGGLAIMSIDQGPGTPLYQGIVELNGDRLDVSFNHYFQQSAQTALVLRTHSFQDPATQGWHTQGAALHLLPHGHDEPLHTANQNDPTAVWDHCVAHLPEVVLEAGAPLGGLPTSLFLGHDLRVHAPEEVLAVCSCSRGKIIQLLRSFGKEALKEMSENNTIKVSCDFCGTLYTFQETDLKLELVTP